MSMNGGEKKENKDPLSFDFRRPSDRLRALVGFVLYSVGVGGGSGFVATNWRVDPYTGTQAAKLEKHIEAVEQNVDRLSKYVREENDKLEARINVKRQEILLLKDYKGSNTKRLERAEDKLAKLPPKQIDQNAADIQNLKELVYNIWDRMHRGQ